MHVTSPPPARPSATPLPPPGVGRAPAPARSAGRAAAIGLGLLLAAAALLYRPWTWRPIGIGDVADYLPLLRQGHTIAERVRLLTEYYAREYGRFNPATFVATAVKWSLFPESDVAMYALRFAVMSAIVLLTYALLRRLGASRPGAVLGASLYVVAPPGTSGWIVISVGEPLGLLVLLPALLLAARYRTSARWGASAAAIAALCLVALLAKEMLACMLPLVVVLATCHEGEGRLARPRLDARSAWLVGLCVAATAIAAAGVLHAAARPSARNFGSGYRFSDAGLDDFSARLSATLLVASPVDATERAMALFVNVVVVTVLWLGVRAALRSGGRPSQVLASIGVAMLPPVVGAALYAPWPTWADIYALPMLLGPCMLVASALTWLREATPTAARPAVAALAVALVLAGTSAARRSDVRATELRVNHAFLRDVGDLPPVDRFVLLTKATHPQIWRTNADLARAYALGVHRVRLPEGATLACADSSWRRTPRVLVIGAVADCGPLARPTLVRKERYAYVDWSRLALRRDSVQLEAEVVQSPASAAAR